MNDDSKCAVSVVVPTFNRGHYIEECIDSVLNQTIPPREVIVVDDGSTDDTARRLARYGGRIRYMYKQNEGKSAALNFALPNVSGAYVWFFDDDDVALPDAIERRLAFLEAHADVAFVSTGHYLGSDGEDGKIRIGKRYALPDVEADSFLFELMKGCYFTLQSVLVRTAILREVGGFDETLVAGEDYDIMLRLAQRCQGAVLEAPTFIFRQHDGERGPAGQRYREYDRQKVFQHFERVVGLKLRNSTPLGHFLVPKRDGTIEPKDARHALFRRMLVMGSKGLVTEMMEDLRHALTTMPSTGKISEIERDLCRHAVCVGYAESAIAEDWRSFLNQIAEVRVLPQGQEVVRSIAGGFGALARSYPGGLTIRARRLLAAIATYAVSQNVGLSRPL
jgi:GT2 family glycosyltransferase